MSTAFSQIWGPELFRITQIHLRYYLIWLAYDEHITSFLVLIIKNDKQTADKKIEEDINELNAKTASKLVFQNSIKISQLLKTASANTNLGVMKRVQIYY